MPLSTITTPSKSAANRTAHDELIPNWKNLTHQAVLDLVGAESGEFLQATLNTPRIGDEIDRMCRRIDPFLDFPFLIDADAVRKRFAIDRNRVSKAQLLSLVESGAGERELAGCLKQDLSIIGEAYTGLSEEYICFSEFPLSPHDTVDFALFSGRSWMRVTLIEVKGADFNFLVNRNGYKDQFSSRIETAKNQIYRRSRYVYENLPAFREEMHRRRKLAEEGRSDVRCLVGPAGQLYVDPNKDIRVDYLVIGGRTVDDQTESRLRFGFENQNHPPISLETWDSWLRKLDRD